MANALERNALEENSRFCCGVFKVCGDVRFP